MILKKKLSALSTLAAISLVCGCGENRQEYDDRTKYTDSQISHVPLVLVGKEVRTYHYNDVGYLYFSLEGTTNQVSFLGRKKLPCAKAGTKFFEARIGDKKTPIEWRKALSHRNEDDCSGVDSRTKHDLTWEYVRED